MFQILDCSDLGTCCTDYALANFLDISRKIFDLIQLIAPIALIVAASIQLAKLVINPEEKSGNKKIFNKFLAAVTIFFIPILFNVSIGLFPDNFSIKNCWEQARYISEISRETKQEYKSYNDTKELSKIIPDSNQKYEKGDPDNPDNNGGGSGGGGSGSTSVNLVQTNGVLSWPTPTCKRISSTYGNRTAPVAGATSDHRAIDIACAQGSDVTATYAGTVSKVVYGNGYNGGRGYYVVLKHSINGRLITTEYQHLSQILVSEGASVQQGQVIAKSGGTPGTPGAGATSGAHLHFEVHDGEFLYHVNEVNPCSYLGISTCYGDVSSQLKG